MKLTKDTLIEGQIVEQGTVVEIIEKKVAKSKKGSYNKTIEESYNLDPRAVKELTSIVRTRFDKILDSFRNSLNKDSMYAESLFLERLEFELSYLLSSNIQISQN